MSEIIIYKIEPTVAHDEADVYFGSTGKTLAERFNRHKSNFKCGVRRCTSVGIFEKYGVENCVMIELERCCAENRNEREGHYIRTHSCVNQIIPDRTVAEYYEDNREFHLAYYKQYREDNREVILARHKQYREEHKEHLKEWAREKFNCPCGGRYSRSVKSRHFKTPRHQVHEVLTSLCIQVAAGCCAPSGVQAHQVPAEMERP